jgi:hypothetical protein
VTGTRQPALTGAEPDTGSLTPVSEVSAALATSSVLVVRVLLMCSSHFTCRTEMLVTGKPLKTVEG